MAQPGFKQEAPLDLGKWSDQDELVLSGVSVHQTLSDINFSIKGKKKIGIIGASGAGKSTLIDVLGGFLATDGGTIEVKGSPRSHLQADDWQKNLLYIPQHPYIFDDTLMNNIRFYHPDASSGKRRVPRHQRGFLSLPVFFLAGLRDGSVKAADHSAAARLSGLHWPGPF